jgi:uncharacterized protein (DUF488 family)
LEIYTIGFAGKTAEQFFEPLMRSGVQQVVDVRLNNVSQLAGFTKKTDLPYFLKQVAGMAYTHEALLAPNPELLKAYRNGQVDWETYEQCYLNLLAERDAASAVDRGSFAERTCLLCSEASPDRCHRRLAAEYLAERWPNVRVEHL